MGQPVCALDRMRKCSLIGLFVMEKGDAGRDCRWGSDGGLFSWAFLAEKVLQ